ncbi:MAG TPA: hypothetical protein VKT28_09145 [Puia sp.]|nr:hypothetical protein [Puia sp.]
MDNNLSNYINTIQTLEYVLSVFLFFLIVFAYFLLLRDQEKIR